MSEYDLHHKIKAKIAFSDQLIDSNTVTHGKIIDTSGYEAIEFVGETHGYIDGNFAFLIEQSDNSDLSQSEIVPKNEILGSLAGFSENIEAEHVGSLGKKRYQRMSIVSTNVNAGGAQMSGLVILAYPKSAPPE